MPQGTLPPKLHRAALEALSRDRLGAITDKFNLAVEDRRAHAAHVDAIVRARSLDFQDVLRFLARDELKDICTALGLDDSGREKEAIIRRILGADDQKELPLKAPVAADSEGKYIPARTTKKNGGDLGF